MPSAPAVDEGEPTAIAGQEEDVEEPEKEEGAGTEGAGDAGDDGGASVTSDVSGAAAVVGADTASMPSDTNTAPLQLLQHTVMEGETS